MHKSLEGVRGKYGNKIAVTYIPFPLEGIHPHAIKAARAAECARRLGAMDPFVAATFQKQDSIGVRPWDAYRSEAGIKDSAAFASCLDEESSANAVHAGMRAPPGVLDLLDAPTAASSRTDVNGVRMVMYPLSVVNQVPKVKLGAVPIAIAGSLDDPDFDLTRVNVVELLDDGRLVTFSRVDGKIQLYGSKGRGEKSIGRRGRGPNEVQSPRRISRLSNDTILVLDEGNRRVYRATPNNGIVSGQELPTMTPSTDQLAGMLPTQEIVLYRSGRFPAISTVGSSQKRVADWRQSMFGILQSR